MPFFFKQWGEWRPANAWERIPGNVSSANLGRFYTTEGSRNSTSELMVKVGKATAGRTLDGRTWDEYPT